MRVTPNNVAYDPKQLTRGNTMKTPTLSRTLAGIARQHGNRSVEFANRRGILLFVPFTTRDGAGGYEPVLCRSVAELYRALGY